MQAIDTELKVPEQEQLLTPTEIRRELNLNGRRVNEILACMGYQHKINDSWEAIVDGINYCATCSATSHPLDEKAA